VRIERSMLKLPMTITLGFACCLSTCVS